MSLDKKYLDFDIINEITDIACNDIERFLHELGVDARLQGKKYAGACPVHGGDNPGAFNIYPDGEAVRGIWICRTNRCHEKWKKTLIGLVQGVKSHQLNRKFTWKESIDWICNFNGVKLSGVKLPDAKVLEKRKASRIVHKLNITPQQKTSGWTRDWVRKQLEIPSTYYVERGYSKEILDRYDVGFYKPLNRVSVPVYDNNHSFCVGFSARSLNTQCPKCGLYHEGNACIDKSDGLAVLAASKWRNSKDFESSNYMYNYWFAKEHIGRCAAAILVEGPGDVWRLEENGIKISLGMFGVELKEHQRVILDSSGALSLIIMLDNDEAGRNAAIELKKKLGRTYRLYFPRISGHDVGELNSDSITKDIEPIIRKLTGVK
jgi:5S rRNA maturation endonuclease (ribonuclease M5)